MSSPADYLKRISEVVGDDITDNEITLNLRWSNRQEGDQVLGRVRAMQAGLRQVKKDVAHDMAIARSKFTTERTRVGKTILSGIAAGFLGRKTVGSYNAAKRDDLRRAQMLALEPYERVKQIIDDIIHKLEGVKARVEASEDYSVRPARPSARTGRSTVTETSTYLVRLPSGEAKGPLTAEQVRGLLIAGVISQQSEVQVSGISAWVRVSEVSALSQSSSGA